ncbi:MAG: peptidoglycan editing factor PgeF [Chloroflexia bacterium]|nr:peptidoglycan editing factor PgeF [Chloroflexia bacterium]
MALFRFESWTGWDGLLHAISDREVGSVYPAQAGGRQRLAKQLGLGLGAFVPTRQVHSDRVLEVPGPAYESLADEVGVDGLVTAVPGLVLLGYFADCVPLLAYDPQQRAVGLAHAGWRGTLQGIAGRLVQQMVRSFGTRPADLVAGIGPSIGPCCYEVGPEVIEGLHRQLPQPETLLRPSRPGHAYLDLWAANRQALLRAGLSPQRIEVAGLCTACHVERFFSYRREGRLNGLFGAVIGLLDE